MTYRVLMGEFAHETNTFSVQPADLGAFRRMFLHVGDEVPAKMRDTNTEIAGFLDVADRHGWEVVHTVACFATPCGKVTDAAWDELSGRIVRAAKDGTGYHGVLLALHGAMVSESHDDAEGQILEEVRAAVGPEVPIAVTLDLHANVSDRMAALANIMVSYRTYPHVDLRDRARQAGTLLERTMAGEICPRVVLARRALLALADNGRTDAGPMPGLLAKAAKIEEQPDVLAISINAGFSHADVPHAGPTILVTGDGDNPRFREIAKALMDEVWEARDICTNTYLGVDEAAALAGSHDGGGRPLIIADYADNPGGGAYGDATNLLRAMLDAGLEDTAFGSIRDGPAAEALHAAGVGASVTLEVGGRTDPARGGPPLALSGEVAALTDGHYVHAGPMWKGTERTLGPSAVFRVGGIDILIATNLMQVLDLNMFIANGIDPRTKKTVALKSMQHFRAAFEPIASRVVVADSGALCSPDCTRLTYRRVRRPIYPLDTDPTSREGS